MRFPFFVWLLMWLAETGEDTVMIEERINQLEYMKTYYSSIKANRFTAILLKWIDKKLAPLYFMRSLNVVAAGIVKI